RRRHTRSTRDWSSDVCSSDLENRYGVSHAGMEDLLGEFPQQLHFWRSEDCSSDWRNLAWPGWKPAPAVRREGCSRGRQLANGKRTNFVVGRGDAADKYRDHG